MNTLYIDIEGNNLMPAVDTIWCVCVAVDDDEEVHTFRDKGEFVDFLAPYNHLTVVAHNGLGYDFAALRKVWGIPFTVGKEDTFCGKPCQFVDTLLLSQLLNADRQDGHSLKEWGKRLGNYKGEWNDWTQYSEGMAEYCRQDVRTLRSLYKQLLKEIENY